MRWLVALVIVVALAAAFAPAFAGEPPVTQAEAVEFHARGLCVMSAPGSGLTGRNGWVGAYSPGLLRLIGARFDTGSDTVDAVPGKVYFIVDAGQQISWCPQFTKQGREACGPVPPAFLYDPVMVR